MSKCPSAALLVVGVVVSVALLLVALVVSWPLRRPARYVAVIVGEESGTVTPLTFVTFATAEEGRQWVELRNQHDPSTSTHYELRPIGTTRRPMSP